MIYKFLEHKAQLENPTIEAVQFVDSVGATSMNVNVTLGTENAKLYNVDFGVFDYSSTGTYEDSDVMEWVRTRLEDFQE